MSRLLIIAAAALGTLVMLGVNMYLRTGGAICL